MSVISSFRGSNAFLSNMYPIILRIDGQIYPSAEHAFQAMKSTDPNQRAAISVCRSPEEAKKAGRLVELRSDWEHVKVDIMYNIIKQKFSSKKLANKLIETKDSELIEGNTWGDTFWGVCKGEGKNMLGKILMQVRKELL